MNKYNICFCADDNIVEYMSALIVSILKNSLDNEYFSFHIITTFISEENKNNILLLKSIKDFEVYYYSPISRDKHIKWRSEKTNCNWSVEVFSKLDIPYILSHLDNVLYLDCDMIVLGSLYEVFDTDIINSYLLVVKDKYIKSNHLKRVYISNTHKYFNGGFIFFNIKKIIKDFNYNDFLLKIEDYIKSIKVLPYGEQDILNYIFMNRVQYMNSNYNFISALVSEDKDVKNVIIAHYTMIKPFYKSSSPKKNKLYYAFWKYFICTPYFKNNSDKYIDILIEQGNMDIIRYNKIIDKISWFIPFKNLRTNFKYKYKKETSYFEKL